VVKRLVVPLDQSSFSESALPLARGLSRQLNLPVSLVTVVDAPNSLLRSEGGGRETAPTGSGHDRPADPLMPTVGASVSPVSHRDLEKLATRVADAEKYLRRIAESFPDTNVETEVMYGDPSERILSFSESRHEPALVMASHGRSGITRMLIGSVTARVVQSARIPVFVVRGNESASPEGEVKVEKVLVPLDESSFSAQALARVQQVLGSTGLNLVLLHVIETQRARGAYEHPASEEFTHSARQQAESYLEEKARHMRARGHTVECDLGVGRVAERINASAQTFGADLVAMATHGSGGDMRRLFLGSVAEQVLHEADRPLLLIRPED
jgi:nucleotide-binding universal stress UspA family protein